MIRRPPRSTHCISSAASDVYKRQISRQSLVVSPEGEPRLHPSTDPRWAEMQVNHRKSMRRNRIDSLSTVEVLQGWVLPEKVAAVEPPCAHRQCRRIVAVGVCCGSTPPRPLNRYSADRICRHRIHSRACFSRSGEPNLSAHGFDDWLEALGYRSPIGQPSGKGCLLYTSPSPRDKRQSRMPSSA